MHDTNYRHSAPVTTPSSQAQQSGVYSGPINEGDFSMSEKQYEGTILIVTPLPRQLEVMSLLLHKAGYIVLSAADGREGVGVVGRLHPDLVIGDASMPGMNGIEMCRLIRQRPDLRQTPILLIGRGSQSRTEWIEAGADDYLEAPYDMMRLVAKSARLIERRSSASDIIERKQLEERLLHSQKMEAVGRLAGGISHDFNNLLTVITGYSDLAIKWLQTEDPLRHHIEEIRKASDRATRLTSHLLAFSRKQILQPQALDLNAIVADMEKMLRRLIGEDIELRTALDPEPGSIKADPAQIEQVIMNLAVNARDAMPQGGKLTIETAKVFLDNQYATQHFTVAPGLYLMLAVSDTGTGMNEETQSRIFEPFFTTKDIGKGTGLGLSTVYGIIKQSGGNIWVYSEVGRGTTFKMYLPLIAEDAQVYRRSAESEEAMAGTETILLVEDDETVRNLVSEVLQNYGHEVLEAANGGSALLICERHERPIHLLLTDVIMPEMSGSELATRLARLRPEMKSLYMSGYTDDAIVNHGVLEADTPFIQKPFTPMALARKVREVLDRAQ